MFLLEKSVEALAKLDDLKGLADAIQEFIDADSNIEYAEATAKIVAELAAGVAITGSLRVAFSGIRLGLAVSGRIGQWEALSDVLGIAGGLSVGSLIDSINEQDVGGWVFDILHRDPMINTSWNAAINWRPAGRDPLAIDLDGDGIETVGIGSNPVLFDHDANGVKTGTGWVKADDGWLVRDMDGNGTIDSGRELFGVDTQIQATDVIAGLAQTVIRTASTGFEALRALDADANGVADGVFNANDVAFAQLKVWQDLNQDGVSQAGELFTLTEKGLASIAFTESTTTVNLGNGNSVTGTATVTRTTGGTTHIDSVALEAGNLILANNPFYREFTDTVPLTQEALVLPHMGGSGWVRDLREAMSQGSESSVALRSATQTFAETTTRDGQLAVIDGLISEWAGTAGRVIFYESLHVDAYVSPTVENGGRRVTPAEEGDGLSYLRADIYIQFGESLYNPRGYLEAPSLNSNGIELVNKLSVLEVFNGGRFIDFTIGGAVSTGGGAASGGGGGGGGSAGGSADPVTHFTVSISDAQVALINSAYEALRLSVYDALVVQTRLRPYLDAVELNIDETGLHFDAAGLTAKLSDLHGTDVRTALQDLVELVRYTNPTLQAVGFDGTPLLRSWLDELPAGSELRGMLNGLDTWWENTSNGTVREDIYLGDASANAFSAGDGDDVLNGFVGNDVLQGQQGRDTLLGGAGDDALRGNIGWNTGQNNVDEADVYDGGAGYDQIYDFESSNGDVYRLNLGGGQDTVQDDGGTGDRIELGAGIAASDVTVRNVSGQLVISVASGERMTVGAAYNGDGAMSYGAIEEIRFADGTTWNAAAIRQQASAGTAAADRMDGFDGADTMTGADGNDVILAGAGNDVVEGGSGADDIRGERGNDTLLGGEGDDTLYGYTSYSIGETGAGNSDTYDGGAGNDYLQDSESSDGDVYRLNLGGGQDRVVDYGGAADRIEVGAGISMGDVTVRNVGGTLNVTLASGEQMAVSGAYNGDGAMSYGAIEEIRFADGTTWNAAAIRQQASAGTAAADRMDGFDGADTMTGADGNDVILAGAGNDVVEGGSGADDIRGERGNDTLLGGEGDDTLYGYTSYSIGETGAGNSDTYDGGAGNDYLQDSESSAGDVYRLNLGGGQDRVVDYGGAADRIEVGAGISMGDVTVRNVGGTLNVTLASGEQMAVSGAYNGDGAMSYGAIEEIRFADGTTWNAAAIRQQASAGTAAADRMDGFDGADTMTGADGNDVILAGAGNDVVEGGSGADDIRGERGNDTLLGGEGDDTLYGYTSYSIGETGAGNSDTYDGGAGNDYLQDSESSDGDVYRLNLGGGQDRVVDYGGAADRIEVGAGISMGDVTVRNVGGTLNVTLASGEQMAVSGAYNGDGAMSYGAIEEIRFADGTTWNAAAIRQQASAGTAAADRMDGFDGADTMTGADGNDVILAGAGNDVVEGGSGADDIRGERGNDTLLGGEGDDTLYGYTSYSIGETGAGNSDTYDGGAGNDYLQDSESSAGDVYRLNLGGGQDRVVDYGGAADRIEVGAGISMGDVTVRNVGGTLNVTLASGEQMAVSGAYNGDGAMSYGAIEEIRFADGTTWNAAAIRQQASAGTAAADRMDGFDGADTMTGADGNDVILAGAGNDVVEGGSGADDIRGERGNDTLLGGEGNDTLYGQVGYSIGETGAGNSDTYDGGAGNDYLQDAESSAGDVYRFNLGGGQDTVVDYGGAGDRIEVDSMPLANLRLTRSGSNLIVQLAGTSDSLVVTNHFGAGAVEFISNANGQSFDQAYIAAAVVTSTHAGGTSADELVGTTGADELLGMQGNDALTGAAGHDRLDGGTGDDTMNGGQGDDVYQVDSSGDVVVEALNQGHDTVLSSVDYSLVGHVEDVALTGAFSISAAGNELANQMWGNVADNTLWGGDGNDTLTGGKGDDGLAGNQGDDRYVFNLGDGRDLVIDDGGTDTLVFGAGIHPQDVYLTLSGATARIHYSASDSILLPDVLINGDRLVEFIQFADGTLWGTDEMATRLVVATPYGDESIGTEGDDALMGLGGNDTLVGGAGEDLLDGGTGQDSLVGGVGDDRYALNLGDGVDTLVEEAGTDTLVFGAGITPDDVYVMLTETGVRVLYAPGDEVVVPEGLVLQDGLMERAEFADGTVWTLDNFVARIVETSPYPELGAQAQNLVGAMAGFNASAADTGGGTASASQVRVGTVDLASNAVM